MAEGHLHLTSCAVDKRLLLQGHETAQHSTHKVNAVLHEIACELEKAGIEHGWPYPEPFHLRMVSSWQRIFDLGAGDAQWWGAPPDRTIQATFWELTIPQIRHVDVFRAR